jgi:hypothetical protein
LVIALVVTPDGFPLAYEVMNGRQISSGPWKTKRGKNYAKAPEQLEAIETGQQRLREHVTLTGSYYWREFKSDIHLLRPLRTLPFLARKRKSA